MSSSGRLSDVFIVADVIDRPHSHPDWAQDTARWIRDVICRPSPELGRPGALCPHVPAAIQRRTLTMRESAVSADPGLLATALADEAGWFADELIAVDVAATAWMAHVVVFTSLGDRASALREWRTAVRGDYLRNGINPGDFYPENDDVSIRNSRIEVGRAPWPCVALRHFQQHDQTVLRLTPEADSIYRPPPQGAAKKRLLR